MARHTGFQDLTEAEFLKRAEQHVEAMNARARERSGRADARMHICWGNYEGPHDHDIALEKMMPHRAQGQAAGDLVRGRQSAPRARMGSLARRRSCPTTRSCSRRASIPRPTMSSIPNWSRSGSSRFAEIVGRERVIAGTDCGFGTFAGYGKMDPGDRLQEARAWPRAPRSPRSASGADRETVAPGCMPPEPNALSSHRLMEEAQCVSGG